jgi:hypothetical protein
MGSLSPIVTVVKRNAHFTSSPRKRYNFKAGAAYITGTLKTDYHE